MYLSLVLLKQEKGTEREIALLKYQGIPTSAEVGKGSAP